MAAKNQLLSMYSSFFLLHHYSTFSLSVMIQIFRIESSIKEDKKRFVAIPPSSRESN